MNYDFLNKLISFYKNEKNYENIKKTGAVQMESSRSI